MTFSALPSLPSEKSGGPKRPAYRPFTKETETRE